MRTSTATFLCLAVSAPLWACAVAHPEILGLDVKVTEETAVIYHDGKHELLLIYPGFRILAGPKGDEMGDFHFGFIVPTPARPDVREVGMAPFEKVKRHIQPKHVYETRDKWVFGSILSRIRFLYTGAVQSLDEGKVTNPVTVLEEKEVGIYVVAILEATDAGALVRWLTENGYHVSKGVEKWATDYVEKKWYFAAFKISPWQLAAGKTTSPTPFVMEFDSPEPFFPFNEPEGCQMPEGTKASLPAQTLALYVFAGKRVEGIVGGQPVAGTGTLKYAEALSGPTIEGMLNAVDTLYSSRPRGIRLTKAELQDLAPKVGPSLGLKVAGPTTMSAFVLEGPKRTMAGDMFFRPSADQAAVIPPPIVHIHYRDKVIPIEPFALVAALGLAFWWVRRRRRASPPVAPPQPPQ